MITNSFNGFRVGEKVLTYVGVGEIYEIQTHNFGQAAQIQVMMEDGRLVTIRENHLIRP